MGGWQKIGVKKHLDKLKGSAFVVIRPDDRPGWVVRVSEEFSGSFQRPLASRSRRFEESCRGAYIKPWSALCMCVWILILSLLSLSTNSRESVARDRERVWKEEKKREKKRAKAYVLPSSSLSPKIKGLKNVRTRISKLRNSTSSIFSTNDFSIIEPSNFRKFFLIKISKELSFRTNRLFEKKSGTKGGRRKDVNKRPIIRESIRGE